MIQKGNLITLAQQGVFDVVAHGCNCFCNMGAGIAPQMAKAFGCDNFRLEDKMTYLGDMNKLGQIDYGSFYTKEGAETLAYNVNKTNARLLGEGYKLNYAVNCYTQFGFGRNHKEGSDTPLDYEALKLCMRKMNYIFSGQHIGLPWIGCGLAGGDKDRVFRIIETELKDCKFTIVEYDER